MAKGESETDRRLRERRLIFYEDDVPAEWKQFTPINAEWFDDSVTGLGSPGGAAQAGPADKDHPVVAAWATVG